MDYLVAILVAFLALTLLASLIGAFFMWTGAKLAGVDEATFGRSISAASGASFATWAIALIASIVPGVGTAAGILLGAALSVLIIQSAYSTSLGKAVLVWLFDLMAEAIALAISFVLFASVILSILQH
jgi:hypothetical protein